MTHRSILMFAIACCTATALAESPRSAAPDPRHAIARESLVPALRAGGLTLYFRHTATDFSQNDDRLDLSECRTQRNLTPAGREQARRIGAAIEALRLPLGEVIASPYCRTMETARLVSGRRPRESNAVRGRAVPGAGDDYSGLEKILATPPDPGTIRLIAGHGNPMRAIAGAPHLEEGEAMVIKPVPGGWAVAARILPPDWERLAAYAR